MIPLARWLSSERPVLPGFESRSSSPDDESGFGIEPQAADLETLLTNSREQEKSEFDQEVAALVAAVRQEERTNYESREAVIAAEWSARCAAVTGTALAGLLQELHGSIGKALTDVLRPLLPDALHRRATTELLALLNRELSTLNGEFLEVRAPPEMHAELREVLDQLGIHVALTEFESVEVVSKNGISRFEQLAEAWAVLVLSSES